MAIAYVASVGRNGAGTTSSIDTTTCNFLVAVVAYFRGRAYTFSDSASNTWTTLTEYTASTNTAVVLRYVLAPTTSATHTITLATSASAFPSGYLVGFSGVATSSAFDNESGSGVTGGTSVQPGSITPAVDGSLVVTAGSWASAASAASANGSFNNLTYLQDGTNFEVNFAYWIQSTASASNPTWSWTGSANGAVAQAVFKAAASASGKSYYNSLMQHLVS